MTDKNATDIDWERLNESVVTRLHLDDALCFALYNATNAIIRAYRPLLHKINLTYPQYLVMMALWDEGAMRIVDVARRLDLAPNAITPLVDRLEKIELVSRVPSETDRRTSMIHLTDRGAELEKEASIIQQAISCNIALDSDRHGPLLHDLKRIVAGMEQGDLLRGREKKD
ncbi:transcriptional regulator, MarR family protein [Fulvimarina pelagi HTCC2506]|uniref:Transcriptional regulator, MarR family protein n=1 Tax=Fulvimarina pelagi HTCC2506 TaxID=314231 RepID=Q0G7C2_9HYPH|nr:MarR family transcriptional regulator [Fulvimarina pelagi]EAU42442.1 transcriptional regulator, MarR family protein [Fulvimarina pelagi HTCC2506]